MSSDPHDQKYRGNAVYEQKKRTTLNRHVRDDTVESVKRVCFLVRVQRIVE